MSELWASKEIRKEELRGIFVIGAIATLLALRGTTMAQQTANFPTLFGTLLQLAGVKLPETGITWVVVIDNTIAYWLLYVVITCVALIDDFFPRNRAVRGTAYFSKLLSRVVVHFCGDCNGNVGRSGTLGYNIVLSASTLNCHCANLPLY